MQSSILLGICFHSKYSHSQFYSRSFSFISFIPSNIRWFPFLSRKQRLFSEIAISSSFSFLWYFQSKSIPLLRFNVLFPKWWIDLQYWNFRIRLDFVNSLKRQFIDFSCNSRYVGSLLCEMWYLGIAKEFRNISETTSNLMKWTEGLYSIFFV